ncbi:hypothetical protein PSPTOT1_1605 [Pseudomonas syringae pv. tomato T1]|nr:hypothetical protein PSPTOT1_1605 [Pseudomonas syringae pv. tomato T1]
MRIDHQAVGVDDIHSDRARDAALAELLAKSSRHTRLVISQLLPEWAWLTLPVNRLDVLDWLSESHLRPGQVNQSS